MIRAAIALGSNSTRMLCALLEKGRVYPLGRGREDTRLFMGLEKDGRLSPQAMERAVNAVLALREEALALGCPSDKMDLYATSAVRDSANREELARRLWDACGLHLRVLSGEEEARLSFLAVSFGARALVADIGGGSTEVIYGEGGVIRASVSLQIGASRCLKEFPIRTREDAAALTFSLSERILLEAEPLLSRRGTPLTGIGGTCTACQSMLVQNRDAFPDGEALTQVNLSLLRDRLAPMAVTERAGYPGLPSQRAEHIVHGLCILCAVLTVFRPETVTFSALNNLDGWMAQLAAQPLP